MALDPSLLTPAAIKARMLSDQTQGKTMPSMDMFMNGGMSLPRVDLTKQMSLGPSTTPSLGGFTGSPASMGEQSYNSLVSPSAEDEANAKAIGGQLLGESLNDVAPKNIESLATDDPEKVDPEVKDVYDQNPEFAKIMGALTKLTNNDKSTDLLKNLVEDKYTPDEARAEVNKFFNISDKDETPVWADVALSVGLSLLRGEGGKGEFLSDLGVAGQRGLATAQARRKEKKAESLMLNKLAFGLWSDKEKNRQTLAVQLQKQLSDQARADRTYGLELSKYFQNTVKMNETQAKNRSSAITSTIGLLTKDQKQKALPIIAKGMTSGKFNNVATDDIPGAVLGLLKNNGLDLKDIPDAGNIVESNFVITDKPTYDRYKTAFPAAFPEDYQQGKEYRIQGFSDKSKDAGGLAMTNVLSVQKSVGGQDELSRLFTRRDELNQSILGAPADSDAVKAAKAQLGEINGRIELLTTRKSPTSYIFADGKLIAAGEGAAGAYQQADAISKATSLSKQGNSLASAFGLADGISRSLASTERPADAVGVVAQLGRYLGGVRGQLGTMVDLGDRASDNAQSYLSGDISDAMRSSSERVGNTTVGKVFSSLDKLTKGNTELNSQMMSFAYALAGSRETGKLTDKDVAAALITFGGGDIAEGKWFANPDVLINGVNQALTTATNDYAIRYNAVHNSPANIKYLKETEGLSDSDISDRTTFDVNRFLKSNEGIRKGLTERVIYDGTSIKMQSLDKYRGDGAGNVDAPSGLSETERGYARLLNDAASRARLDPSDPNYIDDNTLNAIIQSVPQTVLEKLRNQ